MKYELAILGSMGPLATVKAFELFVTHTSASCDNDHIPIIVFGDSSIPDRTQAICGIGESPVPYLLENIKLIEMLGIKHVFIPCNTCHYFLDNIQEKTSLHLINMVEKTAKYVQKKYPGIDCYVLGTDGTLRGRVYKRYFESIDTFRELYSDEQSVVMNTIYSIKNSGISDEAVYTIYNVIRNRTRENAAVFIIGCTELSIIKDRLEQLLPKAYLVDAMEVAVCSTISELKYEIKEESTDLDLSCI